MSDRHGKTGETALRATRVEPTGPTPGVLVELLFFAYRDFVGEADRMLVSSGFGRAHHRVLHFVNRHPGLMVAQLLGILKITKQSLARVLRDLVEAGYLEQRTGAEDRRQRLLFLTEKGQSLAAELLAMQKARVTAALGTIDPAQHQALEVFLFGLIDADTRDDIADLIRGL